MSDEIPERISFRVSDELKYKLKALHDKLGMSTISNTVRHLINTGIQYYSLRDVKIAEIKKEMQKYGIERWELNE